MSMSIVKFSKLLALTFVTIFWLQNSYADVPDNRAISQLGLTNLKVPAENIFVSGQPDSRQLEGLSRAGIRHIINLRAFGEQEFNEAAAVTHLAMEYHQIPVAGMSGVTFENAEKLSALLNQIEGQPVLLHCSSGNRVGALMALVNFQQNHDIEAALKEGRRWGLTRLEDAVRDKLERETE